MCITNEYIQSIILGIVLALLEVEIATVTRYRHTLKNLQLSIRLVYNL